MEDGKKDSYKFKEDGTRSGFNPDGTRKEDVTEERENSTKEDLITQMDGFQDWLVSTARSRNSAIINAHVDSKGKKVEVRDIMEIKDQLYNPITQRKKLVDDIVKLLKENKVCTYEDFARVGGNLEQICLAKLSRMSNEKAIGIEKELKAEKKKLLEKMKEFKAKPEVLNLNRFIQEMVDFAASCEDERENLFRGKALQCSITSDTVPENAIKYFIDVNKGVVRELDSSIDFTKKEISGRDRIRIKSRLRDSCKLTSKGELRKKFSDFCEKISENAETASKESCMARKRRQQAEIARKKCEEKIKNIFCLF